MIVPAEATVNELRRRRQEAFEYHIGYRAGGTVETASLSREMATETI
jgi:hypothetical protein